MSHLVGRYKTYQFAHQFIVEHRFACSRINGSCLHDVPVVKQAHHIVIPVDMRFKNFTAARVVHVRSACVRNIGRLIHDSRMAGVFQAPGRIVRRCFFAEDCIFESCFLKSGLPVVHSLNKVRNPFLRSGRVNVDDNRFLWFHQFATQVFLAVFVFGFETPAGDIRFILHSLRILVKILIAHSKVTYPVVVQSRFHRFLGK